MLSLPRGGATSRAAPFHSGWERGAETADAVSVWRTPHARQAAASPLLRRGTATRYDGSMTGLEILFAARDGRAISPQETTLVDSALSAVDSSEIPDDQVENVRDYINAELLHNQEAIPAEHRAALEKLLQDLEGRG